MQFQKSIVVFTDLDGSFLDHHSYDYAPALPALARLQALKSPVIPVTSKTVAEIKALDLPFAKAPPYVAENGMAIVEENGDLCIHQDYAALTRFMDKLPSSIRSYMRGFHDMSLDEIIQHTSLPEASAKLAVQRQGSEPFLWSGDEALMLALTYLAQAQDMKITQGGRFYHLMGKGGKDQAVMHLAAFYQKLFAGQPIKTIALGDGPNDAAMLGVVDYGVQIPNASGQSFEIENPAGKIIKVSASGPKGWAQGVDQILDELQL